jgi:hypothetical protein
MIDVGIALLVGLVLAGAGYLGYAGKFKGIAMIVGGIMVLSALFLQGYGYWGDEVTSFSSSTTTTVASGLEFNLDVKNGTTGLGNTTTVEINNAETQATILLETCGSGGTQPLAGTHAAINFTITPEPPDGSTQDDLAVIYFESPYLMKYGGKYILNEDSDTYYANWSYAAGTNDEQNSDYEGHMNMLMTETGYCEITYEFDSASSDTFSNELDTIGKSGSWEITFHTADWGWSQTFLVTWILVEQ